MTRSETMDRAAKQRITDALVASVRGKLRTSDADTNQEHAAAELDPEASYSIDDQWQADEDGELVGELERVDAREQTVLDQIQKMDFGPKDVVEPGAVIAFGGHHYVVGPAVDGFTCDGITWDGISIDAPIYPVIEGLRAGATFTFNGQEHAVDLVG